MRTALVTGAGGFVGSALVRELLVDGCRVIALVRPGHRGQFEDRMVEFSLPASLFERLSCVEWDLQDLHLLDRESLNAQMEDDFFDSGGNPDFFFHLAWKDVAGPGRCDVKTQNENVEGTADAVKAAVSLGCERFIGVGSIMEREVVHVVESPGMRPTPPSIYSAAKLSAHLMAETTAAGLDIDFVWAMITNAYGVGEVSPRLVNQTLRKCIAGESPQFTSGTQMYDFVYVDDVAQAICLVAEKGKPYCDYLIGSGRPKPLKEFLLEMKDAVAPDLDFRFGSVPYEGVSLPLEDYDCTPLMRDTGFRPTVSFPDGCRRTIEWLRQVD